MATESTRSMLVIHAWDSVGGPVKSVSSRAKGAGDFLAEVDLRFEVGA